MVQLDRRAALRAIGACFAVPAVTSVGCGGAPAKSPYDALSVPDERTAITWITLGFRRERVPYELSRQVSLGDETKLIADVAAVGEPWGVAWLRSDEWDVLSPALGKEPVEVEKGALWVRPGFGDDGTQRVLLLLDKHYEYDPDPRGTGVVRSIQEAQARVVRDVIDFLVRGRGGQVP